MCFTFFCDNYIFNILDAYSTRCRPRERSESTASIDSVAGSEEDVVAEPRTLLQTSGLTTRLENGSSSARGNILPNYQLPKSFPPKQRKTTVAALFEAFEDDDIEKLRSLTASIQKFDR